MATKLAAMMECHRVGKVLQRYLDGNLDDHATRRVAAHLDACRRCGFEATTYEQLKVSLHRGTPVDELALTRLRAFADTLATGEPSTG